MCIYVKLHFVYFVCYFHVCCGFLNQCTCIRTVGGVGCWISIRTFCRCKSTGDVERSGQAAQLIVASYRISIRTMDA